MFTLTPEDDEFLRKISHQLIWWLTEYSLILGLVKRTEIFIILRYICAVTSLYRYILTGDTTFDCLRISLGRGVS